MSKLLTFAELALLAGCCKFGSAPPSTGVAWRHVGVGMGGNSYWLTVDPNDDQTLFYAPDVGGVYRTKDGGKSWKRLAVDFSHERRIGPWTMIEVAPSDSKVVYASASQRFLDYVESNPIDAPYIAKHGRTEAGLVRSMDGGETWESLYGSPLRPGALAIDPDDPNTLWVAGTGYDTMCLFAFKKSYDSHGEGWVAKSMDGGKTWKYVYAGCTDSQDANARKVCYSRLLVDRTSPKDRRTLYLSGNGDGVWKSTDGGTTWVPANRGLPTSCVGDLAISYGVDGTPSLYAAGCYSPQPEARYQELRTVNKPGIYRSDDGGASWRDVSGNLNRKIARYRITVSSTDKNVMYTAQTRRTDTAGEEWCVLKTTDGGRVWNRCVTGRDQTNLQPDRWNQHKSFIASPDTFIVISAQNPDKLWFADTGCLMWETHDAGGHWSVATSDSLGEHRFKTRGMDDSVIVSMSVSPKNSNFLLMCCHDWGFLSSVDGGETFYAGWQTGGAVAAGDQGGSMGFMSVIHDPHDPLRAYAGSKAGGTYISEGSVFLTTTDGGHTWHAPEANPKGMRIGSLRDILSDEAMKEVEYKKGTTPYRKGHYIFLNWALRHLAIDSRTGRIFASKRTGVYYSDNKGGDWRRATFEGIGKDCDWGPNYVQVDEDTGKVYAIVSYMPLEGDAQFSMRHTQAHGRIFDPVPDSRGGLYVSGDGGATFRRLGKSVADMILPQHFAIAPGGRSLYVGTGACRVKTVGGERRLAAGVFRSDDAGETWHSVLSARERLEGCVYGIAINPKKPDIVYVAMSEPLVSPARAAILRTMDGGQTWKDISGDASHYAYSWLSLSAADPADILVGTCGAGAYIGHDYDVK